jgi:hypothetical protein
MTQYFDDSQINTSNKKSRTSTFRISSETSYKLEAEAQDKGASFNALVNQVLRRYVEWNTFEQKTGMVPIPKPVLSELFDRTSEEELVHIAKIVGKNTAVAISLFVKNNVDVDSFVSWFLERMKNCSVLSREYGNVYSKYILKHELGYKWSLFHKTVLDSVFGEILHKPIQTEISCLNLMFKVTK